LDKTLIFQVLDSLYNLFPFLGESVAREVFDFKKERKCSLKR
jgi:hypothetical protein